MGGLERGLSQEATPLGGLTGKEVAPARAVGTASTQLATWGSYQLLLM